VLFGVLAYFISDFIAH